MTITKYGRPAPGTIAYSSAYKQAIAEATCRHEYRLVVRNPTHRYCKQCVMCGHTTVAIAKASLTTEEIRRALPHDEELQIRGMREQLDKWQAIQEQFTTSNSDSWFDWYNEYLLSDVWLIKRQIVMDRANGTCEACGVAMATHVHHLTYERVGREPLFDLVAVCHSCHTDLHGREF